MRTHARRATERHSVSQAESESGVYRINGNSPAVPDRGRVAPSSLGTPYPGRVRVVRRREEIERAWEGLTAIEASGFALDLQTGRYLGPVRLNEDGILLSGAGLPDQPVLVQLEGYAVAYRFAWDARSTRLPQVLFCEATRQDRRARVSRRVKIDVVMPGAGTVREIAQFAVRDVSHGGVGLTFDGTAQRFQIGQRLEQIVIRWKGGDVLRGSAVVAHVSVDAARPVARCGLVLELSDETWSRWHALVDDILYPHTVQGPADARVFWDAYVESGYLNLSGKAPSEFEADRAHFEEAQRLLCAAPDIGAAFATGDKNRLEAFAHQLQVWDGSWLWYHLCRLPTGRSLETSDDHVLVELYSRAYHYVRERGARWLVTYIQKNAGYSRMVHHESALELEGLGKSCVVPFHAIEITCTGVAGARPAGIESATAAQREQARVALAAEYPPMHLAATGLDAPELRMDAVTSLWAEHGLERRREVLVAHVGGTIAATAVLDAASPGLHLYGLLDCVRIFVHSTNDATNDAITSLLRAAGAWYASLGRARFVYFRDPSRDPVACPARGTSLGEAYLTVHSVDAIPELIERVFVLAAPNSARVQRRNDGETA